MDDLPRAVTANRVLIPADIAIPVPPPASAHKTVFAGKAFATDWRVTLWRTAPDNSLHARCQGWLDLIDAQMSPYRDDSDLTAFNCAAIGSAMSLPNPLRQVVRHALDMARLTDGAFDPSILSAVELWGFGRPAVPPGLPADDAIARLREAPDWRALTWQDDALIQVGVRLDLCAIAKGFAVDGLLDLVRAEAGVASALVEIGGEVKGWGVQPDGLPWWVEIETASERTLMALSGMAVATSGDDRRFFVHDGHILSHTLDGRTCVPAQTGIARATVFDPVCWRADALATALIVMGESDALAFATRHTIPCLLSVRAPDGVRERLSPALETWL